MAGAGDDGARIVVIGGTADPPGPSFAECRAAAPGLREDADVLAFP